MKVHLITVDDERAKIKIKLTTRLEYHLEKCKSGETNDLPTSLTDVVGTIWKITVTSEPKFVLHGNDEEILNINLSTFCDEDNWRDFWIRPHKNIYFEKVFSDTDRYYHPTSNQILSHISF